MLTGIGIDLVDLNNFDKTIFYNYRAKQKIFTQNEFHLPSSSLAACFASKEALIKALENIDLFRWKNVEVSQRGTGRPEFVFYNEMCKVMDNHDVFLSLSYTSKIVLAVVVIQKQ
jgi:holo-[acyl-carrier protein] synthase